MISLITVLLLAVIARVCIAYLNNGTLIQVKKATREVLERTANAIDSVIDNQIEENNLKKKEE